MWKAPYTETSGFTTCSKPTPAFSTLPSFWVSVSTAGEPSGSARTVNPSTAPYHSALRYRRVLPTRREAPKPMAHGEW